MSQSSPRVITGALAAVLALLASACGSRDAEATAPAEATTATGAPATTLPQDAVFDPQSVPVSAHELGEFPFIAVPEGFVAQGGKTLDLEQKYIFAGNAVRTVEGRYHHADIYVAEGGTWNETRLLRDLETQITGLGGVRVFDGALPEAAAAMIRQNAPSFARDLYDPWPYRFRQYLIRTEDKRVWIEVGYGYNAQMIDLTVVEETVAD